MGAYFSLFNITLYVYFSNNFYDGYLNYAEEYKMEVQESKTYHTTYYVCFSIYEFTQLLNN